MKRIFQIIFCIAILGFLARTGFLFYNNSNAENTPAEIVTLKRLSGENIAFPITEKKLVLIFWDTHCLTCRLELDRLDFMMAKGIIKSNELVAINVGESAETVNEFLKDRTYQFLIALDESGKISESYKVKTLPTVIFLDQTSKILWMSSSLSVTLESKVENFLRKD